MVLNPRINSAEFAPDGRRIVTSSELAVARIWPADGRGAPVVLRSFAEPTHATTCDASARDRSILWGVVDVRAAEALDDAGGVPIPVVE